MLSPSNSFIGTYWPDLILVARFAATGGSAVDSTTAPSWPGPDLSTVVPPPAANAVVVSPPAENTVVVPPPAERAALSPARPARDVAMRTAVPEVLLWLP